MRKILRARNVFLLLVALPVVLIAGDRVTRTRNVYGVIAWQVSLRGETTGETIKRRVRAFQALSNCGAVFFDDSFIIAEPIKVDSMWPIIK